MSLNMNKRDFGSFHASNVQELLNIPEDDFSPPVLPIESPTLLKLTDTDFGKQQKHKLYFLEEDCVFLNHGAFGGVLHTALSVAQQWQIYIERQPLRFYDRELLPHLAYVTRRLAKYVGCDGTDLVLVPNVTTAVNCVLRSQSLTGGDTVYHLSTEYGAVKRIIQQVCKETGSTVQEETLTFPLQSHKQILDLVSSTLKEGTKLAVFDHIPSNTPFVLPCEDIVQLCHQRGVKVLIDGAHALGPCPLFLCALGADYYTSNCHKWFSAPKGSAFLYVDKTHQSQTRPLVISHGFGSGFNSEFIWSGLRDYSPFLALHTVLDFWILNGDSIRKYIHGLANQAASMLVEKWNSDRLVSQEMSYCMQCIRLPSPLYSCCKTVDYSKAEIIQNALYHQFNIEVPIKTVQGNLYVRISVHLYNTLDEYHTLADAVLSFVNDQTIQQKLAS